MSPLTQIDATNVARLARSLDCADYDELHRVSVDEPERFWRAVVDDIGIPLERHWDTVLDDSRGIEWATWFLGARLNIAEACVHRWARETPDREAAVWAPEIGERRSLTGVDNQPYAAAFFEGLPAAFDSTDCFGFSHSVIGSMDDLNAATTPDVQDFFNLYYAPNNATLTVVGDFDPAEAKQLVQDYFAAIPRGAAAPSVSCAVEFGGGEREIVWEDPLANLPGVLRRSSCPSTSTETPPPSRCCSRSSAKGRARVSTASWSASSRWPSSPACSWKAAAAPGS